MTGSDMVAEIEHTRTCDHWQSADGSTCTCCFKERVALSTEQTMHAAWRKRAEQAERERDKAGAALEPVANMSAKVSVPREPTEALRDATLKGLLSFARRAFENDSAFDDWKATVLSIAAAPPPPMDGKAAAAIRALPDPAPQPGKEDREVADKLFSEWVNGDGPMPPRIAAALAAKGEASRVEERAAVVAGLRRFRDEAIDQDIAFWYGEAADRIENGDG
jgi:hypothetical protein